MLKGKKTLLAHTEKYLAQIEKKSLQPFKKKKKKTLALRYSTLSPSCSKPFISKVLVAWVGERWGKF